MTVGIKVLKFGGSVLRDEDDLPAAVHEIYRYWRRGFQVLAVVSAFGGTTDELMGRSKAFGELPQAEALAGLLLTGEATSAALLTMALDRAGIPAKLLNAAQGGLRTTGDPLDAEPVAADTERIRRELANAVVSSPDSAESTPKVTRTCLAAADRTTPHCFCQNASVRNAFLLKTFPDYSNLIPRPTLPFRVGSSGRAMTPRCGSAASWFSVNRSALPRNMI